MRVKAARRRPALPCGGRTNDWTQAEDDVYRRAVAHVTTVAAGTAPNARAAETATAAAGGRATFARGALLYLAAVALVVSRRPDGITYPQFWAEDGMVWFAQAYNEGALPALLSPWTGYAQTFSRLVAAVSLLVPFRDAPLVFNVAAVLAQIDGILRGAGKHCHDHRHDGDHEQTGEKPVGEPGRGSVHDVSAPRAAGCGPPGC